MSANGLRDELDRLREIVREQGETIKHQNERIDELEDEDDGSEKKAQELVEVRSDEEFPEVSDIWIAGLPFGKLLDTVRSKIGDDGGLEDRLIDLEARSDRNGEGTDGNGGRSPLAQLIDLPAETAKEALTANQDRGRRIADRAKKLGDNTPKGLVVRSSDIATQLKKWGESTHTETVSRVIDFINEFGGDDVVSGRHKGRRILVFNPTRVKEYGTGSIPDKIKSHRDVIWTRESGPDPAPA